MDIYEKLKAAKQKVASYIKDEYKQEAADAIAELLSAQAQSDIEEVEIVVPAKSVVRRIDLGACEILDTSYGILFNAKGTMSTLIKPMVNIGDGTPSGAYGAIRGLMDGMENEYKDIEGEELRDAYKALSVAWMYILQAPIFCSLSEDVACNVATCILKGFNDYADKYIKSTEPKDETIEDALKNAEMQEKIGR